MIERLDRGLQHFAQIIDRDLDIDVLSLEGEGRRVVWGRRCMRFAALTYVRELRL